MSVRRSLFTEKGLTLVELIIAMVVVSIALGGVLLAMTYTTQRSADPLLQHQAVAIAESYLDEILGRPFNDPDTGNVCPGSEASRDLYDNVCDYNGMDHVGARDQTTDDTADPQGDLISGLDSYRVRVTVDCNPPALGGLSGNGVCNSSDLLLVSVRVNIGTLVDMTLSSYKTAY